MKHLIRRVRATSMVSLKNGITMLMKEEKTEEYKEGDETKSAQVEDQEEDQTEKPFRAGSGNRISLRGSYLVEYRLPSTSILGNDNIIEIDPEVHILVIADTSEIQSEEEPAGQAESEAA